MSLDAYPNHVAGSFMVAITSTDNPVQADPPTTQPTAPAAEAVTDETPAAGDPNGPESDAPANGSAD
jgi:hypothetical protein